MVNLLTNMTVLIVRGIVTLIERIKNLLKKIKDKKLLDFKLKKSAIDFSSI